MASHVVIVVKNLPASPGDIADADSLHWEDPLKEENDNPLQYSCPENPMDGGAWQATVHRITKRHD